MSLYSEYFYSPEIEQLFSDKETIASMLHFEDTLAKAQAKCGIIPQEAAESIEKCCKIENIDIEKLKKDINLGGNAAIPLVKQLTQIVKNKDEKAAKYVHFGATSQDVVDTAMVLQIQFYINWLTLKLANLETILIELTQNHRQTLLIGRTLLQQARPITFGLKTALWLKNLRVNQQRIEEAKKRILVLTLGGAVGSGNQQINKKVQEEMCKMLHLSPLSTTFEPELAAILGMLSGLFGKIAKDISLLMQTEIAEVFEGAVAGKGGSSTMPHKRNPVTCLAILANSTRIPHLVGSIFSAMPQEHERSAGLWHSGWEVICQIMRLTAGSTEKTIELIGGLEVDKNKMLQNLEMTQGLIYAEGVSLFLAQKIGKAESHELIEKACKKAISEQKHLKTVLVEMNIKDIDELFKPENSIGNSLEIIDEILNNEE